MHGIIKTRGQVLSSTSRTHAPITPNFSFGSNCEIIGGYVEKWMLAHHFTHYYSWKCQRMVLELVGVINPSLSFSSQPPKKQSLHELWSLSS